MTKRSNQAMAALLAGAAVACAAPAAWADPVKPGSQEGLGLVGKDIPDDLRTIVADPYAAPGDCTAIGQQIRRLDEVLGPDFDSGRQQAAYTWGDAAGSVVRSFIPYRTVVRLVTGANKKDAELTRAVMAGWERRGFLKGLQKHCDAPDAAAIAAAGHPVSAIVADPVPVPQPVGEPAPAPRFEATPVSNPPPADDAADAAADDRADDVIATQPDAYRTGYSPDPGR